MYIPDSVLGYWDNIFINDLYMNREAKRMIEQRKKEMKEKEQLKIKMAVTSIQALVRGALGRIRHKKHIHILKREQQVRRFCVECESKVATKRCIQCKDRYCESCYTIIHKKGYRRGHSWEPLGNTMGLKDAAPEEYNPKGISRGGGTANNAQTGRGGGTAPAPKPASNAAQWQEFFDAGAKAKYWYNTITGEATWVCPF